jgi:hypothetical protein
MDKCDIAGIWYEGIRKDIPGETCISHLIYCNKLILGIVWGWPYISPHMNTYMGSFIKDVRERIGDL